MGCGASTDEKEPNNKKTKQVYVERKSSDALSDDLSEAERKQVEHIQSRRRKQSTLTTNPEDMDHYNKSTFHINNNDKYYDSEKVKVVESKNPNSPLGRKSSLKPGARRLTASFDGSPRNSLNAQNLSSLSGSAAMDEKSPKEGANFDVTSAQSVNSLSGSTPPDASTDNGVTYGITTSPSATQDVPPSDSDDSSPRPLRKKVTWNRLKKK